LPRRCQTDEEERKSESSIWKKIVVRGRSATPYSRRNPRRNRTWNQVEISFFPQTAKEKIFHRKDRGNSNTIYKRNRTMKIKTEKTNVNKQKKKKMGKKKERFFNHRGII